MSLSSFPLSVSRNRASQWLSRLRRTVTASRAYKQLTQAEFAESDLYSQANCLFKAGYREAAVITGNTAIRRTLRRILASCPHSDHCDLPKKTSSWRQYATHELSYFFFNKGIIDQKLRRELNQFQKNVGRVASGVKLSQAKGIRLLAAINAFRPQLDEAMGRAMFTLPAIARVSRPAPAQVVSGESIDQLAIDLAAALGQWHSRVIGKQNSPIAGPVQLLAELRGGVLVSRKHFKIGCKLFQSPETLTSVQVNRLQKLLAVAQEQASAWPRGLSDLERSAISTMIDRGVSSEKIRERFEIPTAAIEPDKSRDARQVEHWVGRPAMNGGASCQS